MSVHKTYIHEYREVIGIPHPIKFRIFDYLIWIENMHRIFQDETGWQDVKDNREYRYDFDKWLKRKKV